MHYLYCRDQDSGRWLGLSAYRPTPALCIGSDSLSHGRYVVVQCLI